METSPIPPEYKESPNIMFIVDTTMNMYNDFEQTPLVKEVRIRFKQIIEKYFSNWYITTLVKCCPENKSYKTSDYKTCVKSCLLDEINIVRPKLKIGCGAKVSKYVECDYYTLSPHRIIQSSKNEKMFENILLEAKNKLCPSILINLQ